MQPATKGFAVQAQAIIISPL